MLSTRQEPGPYSRHLPALDGLRGLAILAVMLSHFAEGNATTTLTRSLQRIAGFGVDGVDLFFVLSGFLITGILYDSLGSAGYFRNFYARRSLRIFPLYYGVLLVLVLLTPVLHLDWGGSLWTFLLYLQNTGLALPVWSVILRNGIEVSHLWSLAVEEQFYLVWPLLVFLLATRRRILAAALTLSALAFVLRMALLVHGTDFRMINGSTPCRADSLLTGAALALLLRGRLHDRILRMAPVVFPCALVLFLSARYAENTIATPLLRPLLFTLPYTLVAVTSAALIVLCLRANSAGERVFSNAALRFFGRISYGLYVLHYIAYPFLHRHFVRIFMPLTASKPLQSLGASLLILLLSTLAAWLSYNGYERQFLRLKRFFAYSVVGTIQRNV